MGKTTNAKSFIKIDDLNHLPRNKNTIKVFIKENNVLCGVGVDGNVFQFTPAPFISEEVQLLTANINTTLDITILGSYFTPGATVSIDGQTVNSVIFVSAHELIVNVTTGNVDGDYNVTVTTPEGGSYVAENFFKVALFVMIDLRLGGDVLTDGNAVGNDIRYRTGMYMNRDANGMWFGGASQRSSRVKRPILQRARSTKKRLTRIISAPTTSMMVGLGSDATDEASTAQYSQMEVEAYFSASNFLYGLYGNNGTVGVAGSQNVDKPTNPAGFFRLEFERNGEVGETFNIFEIPSGDEADRFNTDNLVKTWSIGGTLGADEANIMPVCLPVDNDTQRYIAVGAN